MLSIGMPPCCRCTVTRERTPGLKDWHSTMVHKTGTHPCILFIEHAQGLVVGDALLVLVGVEVGKLEVGRGAHRVTVRVATCPRPTTAESWYRLRVSAGRGAPKSAACWAAV